MFRLSSERAGWGLGAQADTGSRRPLLGGSSCHPRSSLSADNTLPEMGDTGPRPWRPPPGRPGQIGLLHSDARPAPQRLRSWRQGHPDGIRKSFFLNIFIPSARNGKCIPNPFTRTNGSTAHPPQNAGGSPSPEGCLTALSQHRVPGRRLRLTLQASLMHPWRAGALFLSSVPTRTCSYTESSALKRLRGGTQEGGRLSSVHRCPQQDPNGALWGETQKHFLKVRLIHT